MRSPRVLVVVLAGIVMAFLSAKVLFNGSPENVPIWGVLAALTAWLATSRREAWVFGGVFGFVVSYTFLWFDNSATKTVSMILVLIPLIILPALFGALCGLLAAWIGWMVRQSVGVHKR